MTMTDSDPQVQSIIQNLRQLSADVQKIDNELGTADKGPQALRNEFARQAVASQMVSNKDAEGNETNGALKFVNNVVNNIASSTAGNEELLVAVFTELTNQLDAKYGDTVKKFLQAKVDAMPKSDDKAEVSAARKQELFAERSQKTQLFKLQTDILKVYGILELPSDIEVPKARKGSAGTRVSLNQEFQYFIDGNLKQFTDQDTGAKTNYKLSNIATQYTKKDLNWGTLELRNFIIENVDGASMSEDGSTLTLPDEWEVTLPAPANKKLRGVAIKVTDANANVDDSDDDDEDDDESEGSSDF